MQVYKEKEEGTGVVKFSDAKLLELREKNLPSAGWRTIFELKVVADDGTVPTAEVVESLKEVVEISAIFDTYFASFLPTAETCVCCYKPLTGLFGTFRWGLAHGEGYCSSCGYPGRARHYDIGPIKSLPWLFQYHPNALLTREEYDTKMLAKEAALEKEEETAS
jgi:hypothetical protein